MTNPTKPLRRVQRQLIDWRDELGEPQSALYGYLSLRLRGKIDPELRGDVTGLRGDVTGLWGNVTGLWGNCDQIPAEARPCDVSHWVAPW